MRLTTAPNDPGYRPIGPVRVFVNGKEARYVITADSFWCYVVEYVKTPDNRFLLDNVTGEIATRVRFGIVRFDWSDPAYVGVRKSAPDRFEAALMRDAAERRRHIRGLYRR